MQEIDLTLIKDDIIEYTFVATFNNGDPQNLTGYTVTFYLKKNPVLPIVATLGGVDVNEVTVRFEGSAVADLGLFEYEIIATHLTFDPVLLGRGNVTILLDTGFTTQIQTLIEKEGLGLNMNPDLVTQFTLYWQLHLAPQFGLTDEQAQLDGSWPILVKFLIAKLVVHDYVAHLLKLSLTSTLSTTESTSTGGSSGGLKRLKTGPSEAEWYDVSESLTKLTSKSGSSGASPYDELRVGICQLAHRVRAFLPMCGQLEGIVIVPIKADRVPLETGSYLTLLEKYYG